MACEITGKLNTETRTYELKLSSVGGRVPLLTFTCPLEVAIYISKGSPGLESANLHEFCNCVCGLGEWSIDEMLLTEQKLRKFVEAENVAMRAELERLKEARR